MTRDTLELLQQCLMQTTINGVPGTPEFDRMVERHVQAQKELTEALSALS